MFNRFYSFLAEFFLRRVDRKKLLYPGLYEAVAKLVMSVAIEAVCLRQPAGSNLEIFLIQRSETDLAYPGLWHCPGSIFRPGDTYENVFTRLSKKEFGVPITSREATGEVFNGAERGWFLCKVFIMRLEKESSAGKWFDLKNLPANIVPLHRDQIIPFAVHYWNQKI